MDINAFGYDTKAYESGLWVSNIPGFGDIELLVRGQLSDHAMATRSRIARAAPARWRNEDGSLTEQGSIDLNFQVILESILVDWRNISDGGKALEYSPETAEVLLSNKRFRIGAVAYAIGEVEKLVNGEKEAIVKN